VLVRTSAAERCLFIECKAYNGQRQGGVGFGNGQGEGPQVDILTIEDRGASVLDPHVRWVIVDATMPYKSERFALFDNRQARAAAIGGVASGKQNNFRLAALKDGMTTWTVFCERLKAFVMSG
jgi:hypothetical protein